MGAAADYWVSAAPQGAQRETFPVSFADRLRASVRSRLGSVALGVALVLGATAAPAAAQEISNVKSVDIAVQGSIVQRCQMGAIPTADFGDLTRPGKSAAAKVALDCNMPFTMLIKAQNGALTHSAMPHGQGPYAGSVPYSLDIELPVRRPTTEMISKVFEGRSLTGGQAISSAGGIAVDGLLLRLSLGSVSSEAGLLAGQYGEVIEITIAPN
ncbi:hypothetical protein Q9Q95_20480 [Sphingomonas sp. DG1-23]|uniref:hypothetical protein n=1 Tax=Sphingomonas sp. DG1-23 TaxID=3068316 RepID=UPI00273DCCA8|nr:hypothetical protein [Sphingomonas sp. DG1-23]MDP5281314.1 hypothetical protein [Sphingomonas sp. DG1-23]